MSQFWFCSSMKFPCIRIFTIVLFSLGLQVPSIAIAQDTILLPDGMHGYAAVFQDNELIAAAGSSTQSQLTTEFPIASITKLFVASRVLSLIDKGKLNFTSTLGELIPRYEETVLKKVTIRQLLTHTSGINKELDSIFNTCLSSQQFVDEVLSQTAASELAQGTFVYKNIDFILLGQVLDALVGNWQTDIQQQIISKLAMQNTGFFDCSSKIDGSYLATYGAAGGMYSSANDLAKFSNGLAQQLWFKKGSILTSYPELGFVGFGVWVYNYPFLPSQPQVLERRGAIQSASAVFLWQPQSNRAIIIFGQKNSFDPSTFGDPENLKEKLIKTYFQ